MKRSAAVLAVFLALLPLRGLAAERQGSLEFLFGTNSVNDARFAQIYAKNGTIMGLALTASLFYHLEFYLEAKFFSRTGKLSFTQETTSFALIPFSFGVRYAAPLGIFEPFIGAGLDYFVYYEDNVIGTAVDYTRGGHALAGVRINFGRNAPIGVVGRLKYTLAKATRGDRTIDLGGLELSGGLSVAF